MRIRHENPNASLALMARAPLGLEAEDGRQWRIAEWSLAGFAWASEGETLPEHAALVIPFQGVDLRFDVTLSPPDEDGLVRFSGLSGRQREVLALFYRNLLSGRMAATDEIITSLDTPVDLVPMGETEAEKAAGTARTPPRVLRILTRLAMQAAFVVLVFGVLGGQVWTRIDRVDVQHGRIVAPIAEHAAPDDARIAKIRVAVGDTVQRGDVLVELEDTGRKVALARAREARDAALAELARARAALEHLDSLGTDESAEALAHRLSVAARYQAEFFGTVDLEEPRRIWERLKERDPVAAAGLAPDATLRRQLEALIATRTAELKQARKLVSARKREARALNIRALADGVVREIVALEGMHLRAGTPVVALETRARRTAVGWASERLAETLYVGMPAQIGFNIDSQRRSVPGTVIDLDAGENPTRPGEFGIVVTVAADGMSEAETRLAFRPGAPVSLAARKDLGGRLTGALEQSGLWNATWFEGWRRKPPQTGLILARMPAAIER